MRCVRLPCARTTREKAYRQAWPFSKSRWRRVLNRGNVSRRVPVPMCHASGIACGRGFGLMGSGGPGSGEDGITMEYDGVKGSDRLGCEWLGAFEGVAKGPITC